MSKLLASNLKFLGKWFTATPHERIMRVIQFTVKQDQDFLSMEEMMELAEIQTIRECNGELDEVMKGALQNE